MEADEAKTNREKEKGEAKRKILARLCVDYRRDKNTASDRAGLQRELDIPPTVFSDAIKELLRDGYLVPVRDRSTSVQLGHSGVADCEANSV